MQMQAKSTELTELRIDTPPVLTLEWDGWTEEGLLPTSVMVAPPEITWYWTFTVDGPSRYALHGYSAGWSDGVTSGESRRYNFAAGQEVTVQVTFTIEKP